MVVSVPSVVLLLLLLLLLLFLLFLLLLLLLLIVVMLMVAAAKHSLCEYDFYRSSPLSQHSPETPLRWP